MSRRPVVPENQPPFVYDPNDPIYAEDRLNDDTSARIDWDQIIAETEPDWRAGKYTIYDSWEEFTEDFFRETDKMIEEARAREKAS